MNNRGVNDIVIAHKSVIFGEESLTTFYLENRFEPRCNCNVCIFSC